MDCMAVSADPLTLSGSAGATCAGGGERRSAGCSNAPVVPIALALCWVLLISHPQPNRRSRSVVTGHKLGSRPHSGHSSHTHTHTLAVESGPAPAASNPSVQSIPSRRARLQHWPTLCLLLLLLLLRCACQLSRRPVFSPVCLAHENRQVPPLPRPRPRSLLSTGYGLRVTHQAASPSLSRQH